MHLSCIPNKTRWLLAALPNYVNCCHLATAAAELSQHVGLIGDFWLTAHIVTPTYKLLSWCSRLSVLPLPHCISHTSACRCHTLQLVQQAFLLLVQGLLNASREATVYHK